MLSKGILGNTGNHKLKWNKSEQQNVITEKQHLTTQTDDVTGWIFIFSIVEALRFFCLEVSFKV